jgi:large subunit ribosomal protein L6
MSRVGKVPVQFSKELQVSVDGQTVIVKGKKQTIKIVMKSKVKAKVEGDQLILTRADEEAQTRAFQGLYRSLIQNAVTGCTTGFTKELDLNGVGYRAAVKGKQLELTIGFSHPVIFNIPEGIEIAVDKQTKIIVKGASKELVGQVSAKIRSFRPPEPYLGKGIKYTEETIRRKEGKSAGK